MSSLNNDIFSNGIHTAYAPGFGPQTLHIEAPDVDIPATELTDNRKSQK